MKNDYSFKLVAAIIVAGVLAAFISPHRTARQTGAPTTETAPAPVHAE